MGADFPATAETRVRIAAGRVCGDPRPLANTRSGEIILLLNSRSLFHRLWLPPGLCRGGIVLPTSPSPEEPHMALVPSASFSPRAENVRLAAFQMSTTWKQIQSIMESRRRDRFPGHHPGFRGAR